MAASASATASRAIFRPIAPAFPGLRDFANNCAAFTKCRRACDRDAPRARILPATVLPSILTAHNRPNPSTTIAKVTRISIKNKNLSRLLALSSPHRSLGSFSLADFDKPISNLSPEKETQRLILGKTQII
jgi:hypothetical protein